MSDVKWIKITTDVFDNRKIRMIEKMPEGDAIIIIWFKVLCLAGTINDSGMIMFTPEIPYTEEMLASQFDRPISVIRLAFQTFIKFGMLEVVDNILKISNWEKYQNIEGMEKIRQQTRKRVSAYRERQKLESGKTENNCNKGVSDGCNVTVTQGNATDKNKNKNIEYIYAQSFLEFYSEYPKKLGKEAAKKAWLKLKPDEPLFREIITALKLQKQSEQWTKEKGKFVPYPATWINGRRWEDEIEPSEKEDNIPWI